MGILPQPVTPTVDTMVGRIKGLNSALYGSIIQQHTQIFNMIWNNTQFSASDILTAFGTDAAALFQLSSTIQEMLAQVNPDYVPLVPPLPFVINADGTVTQPTEV
jgi:hypothetical protein